MLTIGIDDAGRGPLIGPMILSGVLVNEEQEKILKEEGICDSKMISHPVRIRMAEIIKDNVIDRHIEKIYPLEIDSSLLNGVNLNTLEAKKMAAIINKLNTKKEKIKVIVDCPSVNTKAWRTTLISFITYPENLDVAAEHKADANYVSVSAASILGKVVREEEVDTLKEKYKAYGNLGSGYPSDPFTQEFIKNNAKELKDSGMFRKTWATWKALFPQDHVTEQKDSAKFHEKAKQSKLFK